MIPNPTARITPNHDIPMLIAAKTLKGYKLHSLDGDIGSAREFYFDDRYWTVRYLVADTGNWLTGKHVLLSPYALDRVDPDKEQVMINLTKEKISASPALSTDKPVSKQFEDSYYGYYGWPNYWNGPYSWGGYPYVNRDPDTWSPPGEVTGHWDHNLRSTRAVTGYHVQASDGDIGHVEDFIIDDETWAIRYLVVNTHNWMPGRHVLISPKWIDSVRWLESKVFTTLSRESVRSSPEYTSASLITRDYESRLHDSYRRQGYWVDELVAP